MSRELTHAIAALKINCPPNLVEIVQNLEREIKAALPKLETPPVSGPKPGMTEAELARAMEKIIFYPRGEQAEIGRQAAAMIRSLEGRLQDACSMVLSDKPMCVVCFETEPHTGHCGSVNPAALCNQRDAEKAAIDCHINFILAPFQPKAE